MLTGQNGILNKAQEAKEKTEIANQDESDKLSSMEAMVQTTGKSIPNPSSYGENPNAQATADGAGKYFALPDGAKYLEGTVDTGVVVEIKGSEFVWVPVDDVVLDTSRTSELPTNADNGTTNGKTYTPMAVKVDSDYKGLLYEFNENNSYLKYSNNKNYQGASFQNREPDILSTYDGTDLDITEEKITIEKLSSNYNAMIESMLKYKGFYVSRYEAGLDTTTNNIVFKDASVKKNNVITLNMNNEEINNWYKLYEKINTFSIPSDNIVSNIIWGSQYDAMINWMIKTKNNVGISDENKRNEENITGKNKNDVINNIYDLYGCNFEWTMEASNNTFRANRGGSSYHNSSPAACNGNYPYPNSNALSSRATLYIK